MQTHSHTCTFRTKRNVSKVLRAKMSFEIVSRFSCVRALECDRNSDPIFINACGAMGWNQNGTGLPGLMSTRLHWLLFPFANSKFENISMDSFLVLILFSFRLSSGENNRMYVHSVHFSPNKSGFVLQGNFGTGLTYLFQVVPIASLLWQHSL